MAASQLPERKCKTDPRSEPDWLAFCEEADAKIMGAMQAAAASGAPPPTDLMSMWLGLENVVATELQAAMGPKPDSSKYNKVDHTITATDGIALQIAVYTPTKSHSCPQGRPAVVYFHGGGMAIGSIFIYDPFFARLAVAADIIVVAPNFRNSTVAPFPAALHDCYSALLWAVEKAKELGIDASRLIVGGESGGGNLAAAVSLYAKQQGRVDLIKGQFLSCPWVSSEIGKFASHEEFDNYLISCQQLSSFVGFYCPNGDTTNPLAFPFFATREQLTGLPPALIVVNELDPLRDEGEAFFRKLREAGVRAACLRMVGTFHGQTIFRRALPFLSGLSLRLVGDFARHGLDEA